jgi:hypothetical protein
VVTGTFDDGGGARQANREPLAGHAAEEGLAAGGAVQATVLPTMMFFGRVTAEVDARAHREPPARQALAGVVVGVADQVQRDAAGEEGAKALAAGAFHLHEDGVVGQAFGSVADDSPAEHRADAAVDVARVLHELHLLAALDGRPAALDQLDVERRPGHGPARRPGGVARRPAPPAGAARG